LGVPVLQLERDLQGSERFKKDSNGYKLEILPERRPDKISNHWRAVASSPGGDLLRKVTSSEIAGCFFSLSLLAARPARSWSVGSKIVKPSAAHSASAYTYHGSV
jgi:hypothetical protein